MRAASAGSQRARRARPEDAARPPRRRASAAIVASSSDVTPQTLMRGARDMPLASYEARTSVPAAQPGVLVAGRSPSVTVTVGAVGAAHERDLHLVARLAPRDGVHDVLVAADVAAGDPRDDVAAELDRRAVERRGDVARVDARPSAAGLPGVTDCTSAPWPTGRFRPFERLVDRQRAHAQEAAVHAPGLLELREDLLGGVDRDREADAEVAAAAAAAGLDLRVDADHAARRRRSAGRPSCRG